MYKKIEEKVRIWFHYRCFDTLDLKKLSQARKLQCMFIRLCWQHLFSDVGPLKLRCCKYREFQLSCLPQLIPATL